MPSDPPPRRGSTTESVLETDRASSVVAGDPIRRHPADPQATGSALDALLRRTSGAGSVRVGIGLPRSVLTVVALVLLAVAWGGWQWAARPAPVEDRMPMASEGIDGAPASGSGDAAAGPGAAGPQPGDESIISTEVVVHVAGAVQRPGVVSLPSDGRVSDALDAAGGLAPGADGDRLNLAAPLSDGARVFVPMVGQPVPAEVPMGSSGAPAGGPDGGGASTTPVDLNGSDAAELESLPGIGPATAAAILQHRERNGPFSAVEELLDVRGIGDAKLDALSGLVTVG